MPTHSTPAGVVTEYFVSLRWMVKAASDATDPVHARRLAAMSIIMAVTAVEIFLNLWFRIHATESGSPALQAALTNDLDRKVSIDQKLASWPKRHLGASLDLKRGPGSKFVSLKAQRNSMVHFSSAHEMVRVPQLIMHGLADTTEYDALTGASAAEALAVAEELVMELFRLAEFDAATRETAASGWIGKPSASLSAQSEGRKLPPWLAPHVQR